MAYRSRIDELVAMRARGQRPDMPIVVGYSNDSASWAARNGMFYVRANECGEDLSAFAGLFVIVREYTTNKLHDLAQRIALSAKMVSLVSMQTGRAEHLVA